MHWARAAVHWARAAVHWAAGCGSATSATINIVSAPRWCSGLERESAGRVVELGPVLAAALRKVLLAPRSSHQFAPALSPSQRPPQPEKLPAAA